MRFRLFILQSVCHFEKYLHKAAAVSRAAKEDTQQAELPKQESSTSPVCAYNEWDPLEVAYSK